METLKKLLFAFVFVSIGFSLGKHHSSDNNKQNGSQKHDIAAQTQFVEKSSLELSEKPKLMVFYCHSTFRCESCNKIEKMTKQLISEKYAKHLETGQMQWEEFNFQKNIELSSAFDVSASCVIVALKTPTGFSQYEKLEQVWQLLDKPEEFNKYISNSVEEFLNKQEQN